MVQHIYLFQHAYESDSVSVWNVPRICVSKQNYIQITEMGCDIGLVAEYSALPHLNIHHSHTLLQGLRL
jgi:hypothetical protein